MAYVLEPEPGSHELDAPAWPPRQLGGGGGFITETQWMRRWYDLRHDLNVLHDARNSGASGVEPTTLRALAPVVADTDDASTRPEHLAAFVSSVVANVLSWAHAGALSVAVKDERRSLIALLAWRHYVEGGDLSTFLMRTDLPDAVHEDLSGGPKTTKSATQRLTTLMWRTDGSELQRASERGLRVLTLALTRELDRVIDEQVVVPPIAEDEARRLLHEELLPVSLALAIDPPTPQSNGATPSYLTRITDVQARSYSRLRNVIENRENMLVLGPAGCGKTRVGHVAAAYAVHSALQQQRRARALILVPTRVLVRESLDAWTDWTSHDDRSWKIVAGSADDREYDEALAEGDFDIGICVYEKLANLLYTKGREMLRNVGVLIVDEFQWIAQAQRGQRLEELLTIIRDQSSTLPIPIIGISATMTSHSARTVRRWLDIRHVVETHRRPTDLRVHVIDGGERRSWLEPKSDGLDDDRPLAPEQETRETWSLEAPKAVRGESNSMRFSIGLALVVKLLEDALENDRRILVFVGQRPRAERAAILLRRAANDLLSPLRKPGMAAHNNPWNHGRFAAELNLDADERAARYEELCGLTRDKWVRQVEDGVKDGIAAHTRSLEPALRTIVEREFRHGLIRVLVATDTLAEGVNMPASDVIVADLDHYDRDAHGYVPIDVGLMRNRLGRAGRLGTRHLEEVGNAYIALNPVGRNNQLAHRNDLAKLTNVDAAWEYWVRPTVEPQAVRSQLDPSVHGNLDALANLALCGLAVDRPRLKRPAMLARIEEILAQTFWAQDPVDLVAVSASIVQDLEQDEMLETTRPPHILNSLEERQLVAAPEESPDELQITRLGLSIARSALPLTSSETIKQLASNADRSPLALFFQAATDEHVRQSMGRWLSWTRPRYRAEPRVSDKVVEYAALYGHPDLEYRAARVANWSTISKTKPRRRIDPSPALWQHEPGDRHTPLLDEILRGTRVLDEERSDESGGFEDFVLARALLRATVALEYARFEPRLDLEARLDKIKRPTRNGKLEEAIEYSPPDLKTLGETCGYVLGATADYLGSDREAQQRLRLLAYHVSIGLPLWLAPLLQLNVPALDRERLLRLHRAGRKPIDDLISVLDWPELNDVPEKAKDLARQRYAERRQRELGIYQELPRELQGVWTRTGRAYSDLWSDLLLAGDAEDVAAGLSEWLDEHAALPNEPGLVDDYSATTTLTGAQQVRLMVLRDELTLSRLDELAQGDKPLIIVPLVPPAHSVFVSARFGDAPMLATIVEPRALLVLLHDLDQTLEAESLEGPLADLLIAQTGLVDVGAAKRLATSATLPDPAL